MVVNDWSSSGDDWRDCTNAQARLSILLLANAYLRIVKPVSSGHSKTRPKIGFQNQFSLNAGQKYCRMFQESILQYFRSSLCMLS